MGGDMTLKVGDKVTRVFMGGLTMPLTVTDISCGIVRCSPWDFDLATGVEIDEDLQWGPQWGRSGSYLEELKCQHMRKP